MSLIKIRRFVPSLEHTEYITMFIQTNQKWTSIYNIISKEIFKETSNKPILIQSTSKNIIMFNFRYVSVAWWSEKFNNTNNSNWSNFKNRLCGEYSWTVHDVTTRVFKIINLWILKTFVLIHIGLEMLRFRVRGH